MCVEKREERHEKRDTHVCGSVRVSTGTEIYLAHTLTQIVLSHWLSYAIRIRLYRARNKRTQRSSHKGGGIKQMPSLMWKR